MIFLTVLYNNNMSAIVALSNAIELLNISEVDQIPIILEALKNKNKLLKTEAVKADKLNKHSDTKRLNILKKIHKIEPSFEDTQQSEVELNKCLEDFKENSIEKLKHTRKRISLEKKWDDKFSNEPCPTDMTNEQLEEHIKSILIENKKKLVEDKKILNKRISEQNHIDKLSKQITKPIPPGSSIEQLKDMLKLQKQSTLDAKKEDNNIAKFRKILNELKTKHSDINIQIPPHTASATELETALKQARELRETKKKSDLLAEKNRKSKDRETKKQSAVVLKLSVKNKKISNKADGEKGPPKNGSFHRFCKHIGTQIENGFIDSSDIDKLGGKGKYNSAKWKELSTEQKSSQDAPWN